MVGRGRRRWAFAALVAVAACGGTEFSADTSTTTGPAGPSGAGGVGVVAAVGTGGSSAGGSSAGGSSAGGSANGGAGASIDASTVEAGVDARAETGAREVGPDDARDARTNDASVAVGPCPPVEPSAGTSCTDGLDCTYGSHPRLACRKQYNCSSEHWAVAPGIACPVLGDCNNETVKPQVGALCATPEHDCLWSSGLYCRCLASSGSGMATWDCYPSPSGCPTTPPNKGQACDLSSKTCDFGTCSLGTKVTTSCSSGVVHWTAPTCP